MSGGAESFGFEIEASGEKAERWVRQLESDLDKLEAKSKECERALQDAIGGDDRMARSAAAASKAAKEQNEQLKRQADLLKLIHGPMQDAMADLKALDALYRQNKISLEEFQAQQARIQGGVAQKPAASMSDQALGSFKGMAAAAGIAMGAHEVIELADAYTEVANKIRTVTESNAEFNDVMGRTREIANDTRTGWGDIVGTFQRLSVVTHDLGLSQSEVLNLTREMSQAAKISGATTQESAMAMSELTHAFEIGNLTTREFKVLMRDTPMLMHELQVASGHSTAEFANMGKHGKITAELLIEWFGKADADIQAKFAKTVPTMAERWTVLKNEVSNSVGDFNESTHATEALGAALHVVGTVAAAVGGFFKLLHSAVGDAGIAIIAAAAAIYAGLAPLIGFALAIEAAAYAGKKLADWMDADMIAVSAHNKALGEALEAYNKEIEAVIANMDAIHSDIVARETLMDTIGRTVQAVEEGNLSWSTFSDAVDGATGALTRLTDKLDKGMGILVDQNKDLDDAIAKVDAYSGAIVILKTRLDQLTARGGKMSDMLTSGDVATVRAYRDAQQDLNDMTLRYGKVVVDIHKTERDRARGVEDLKAALADNVITQEEYTEAVKKYLPHAAKHHKAHFDIMKMIREHAKAYEDLRKQSQLYDAQAHEVDDAIYSIGERAIETTHHLKSMLTELDKAGQKTQNARDSEIAKLFQDLATPTEQFETRLAHINELFPEGARNVEVYARAVRAAFDETLGKDHEEKIKAQQDANDKQLAIHMREFQERNRVEAQIVAQLWAPAQTALIDMFTTGTFALDSFAKNMEKVLSELALKIIMTSALMGLFGMKNPAMIGALGGDAQLGKMLGFATGGSFTVGGSGGTDSQVVAFRATPGERVSVATPAQQGPSDGGQSSMMASSPGPSVVMNVFDRRALLPVLRTSEGRNEVLNIIRDNPGAVRGLLGGG